MDRKTRKNLKKLQSKNPKDRYDAVLALGKTGDIELLDKLDEVANLDENPKVRNLASKAVRTLEILKQRQHKREVELADEGVDEGLVWRPLMKDKIFEEERERVVGAQEEWSYLDSKKSQIQMQQESMRQREIEEQRRLEAERIAKLRRRRPFRIFLMLITTLTVVMGIFVAWYFLNVEPAPDRRSAVLADINTLLQAQKETVAEYDALLANDPLDCPALLAVDVPARPRWVELYITEASTEVQAGFLEKTADGMNRINESLLAGLEPTMTDLDRIHARLTDMHDGLRTACEGRTTLQRAQWEAFATQTGIGDPLAQARRTVAIVENVIAQELPPSDRNAALLGLQGLIGSQQNVMLRYEAGFAADPIVCANVAAIAIPALPVWATSVENSDGLLTGMEAVIDAMHTIDENLKVIKQAIDAECAERDNVPQSEWAMLPDVVRLNDEVSLLIDSSADIVFQEIVNQ